MLIITGQGPISWICLENVRFPITAPITRRMEKMNQFVKCCKLTVCPTAVATV